MNEIEKAINILNNIISDTKDVAGTEEYCEAVRLGREALVKQIPKKVKGLSQTHEGYVGNCPYCGKFITRRESKRVCGYENCLQRLDWSVEE